MDDSVKHNNMSIPTYKKSKIIIELKRDWLEFYDRNTRLKSTFFDLHM